MFNSHHAVRLNEMYRFSSCIFWALSWCHPLNKAVEFIQVWQRAMQPITWKHKRLRRVRIYKQVCPQMYCFHKCKQPQKEPGSQWGPILEMKCPAPFFVIKRIPPGQDWVFPYCQWARAGGGRCSCAHCPHALGSSPGYLLHMWCYPEWLARTERTTHPLLTFS